ncbi:GspE/PulE family protein [Agathobaculum butyriciproducens]|uniref:GspE/PulE family protein n=1 Tax=Agathobaculum butyriciproducens TaxID=1628085 RepID=UPI0020974D1B|nr:GspE/PulE family protein [Agathobaculum butyriciproducens]
MNLTLTERDKKLLGLTACLAILAVFGVHLIRPALAEHEALGGEYEAALQKQQEYQAQIDARAALDDSIAQNEAALKTAGEPYYPAGLETRQMDDIITGIALKNGLFPQSLTLTEAVPGAVRASEGSLEIVTNDPLNYFAFEEVRQLTGCHVVIRLSELGPLQSAIRYYYAEVGAQQAAQTANEGFAGSDAELVRIEESESGDPEAPIVKLLSSLLDRAVSTDASDIHIEPFEGKTRVRMRIDGTIVDYVTLERSVHQPLIARIKIMANLDIAERRLPQDGHFRIRAGQEGHVNIRVSLLPTVFGEKAVLRILAAASHVDHAEHFGMDDDSYARFLPMLNSPNGIIYLTGPTGSGKSTTLYMVLEYLSRRQVNISTVEDPVEQNVPGINQTQVNPVAGLTFESGLRALLRQDPDIIMVGETRDGETAGISVRAAITGHLVLSTLHTNDAVSSVVRLADMGVDRYLIANSLVGLVAQRLMRKVCPHCAREAAVTPQEQALLGRDIRTVRRGAGCMHCNGTGYRGRVAVHEIVAVDRSIRRMISRGAEAEEIEAYAREHQGMKSLREKGLELVREGVTTPEELLRIAYYA